MKKTLLLFVALLSLASTTFAQTINLPYQLYFIKTCQTDLQLDGTVTGTTDIGITYQWYASNSYNFTPSVDNQIPGATSSTYTILPDSTIYGYYQVIATLSNNSTLTDKVSIIATNNINTFETIQCFGKTIQQFQSYWTIELSGNVTFNYYYNKNDADLGNTNYYPKDLMIFPGMHQQLYLRIDDKNSDCFEVLTIQLGQLMPVYANPVPDMGSCTDTPTNSNVFDLTTNDNAIRNQTWLTVSYHLTWNDAFGLTNPIANPKSYTATSPNQTIYARVSDPNNINFCQPMGPEITQFQLRSIVKPTPNSGLNYIVCDTSSGTSSDGIGLFNLTSKIPLVLAGLSAGNYTITYYKTLVNAENGMNQISNPTSYSSANATVYCRIQDKYISCNHIVAINLAVQNTCDDISVNLISPKRTPRPGFDYTNRLIIKNNGPSTVASGSVTFQKDPIATYKSASGLTAGNTLTETPTGFVLNFVNLAPGKSEIIDINMTVSTSAKLGDLLTNTATYTTNVNDVYAENNTATLSEVIIGSYDPNDIAETHGPEIVYETFTQDDYLYYTIRFQNVGTASAINVTIDNTLESKLDKTTFEMLSSSHNYTVNRVFDKVTWTFNNINLADATSDEPGSHGYVYYKIKPLAGYKVADIINNDASIVFDFNAPIVTNTFKTEFVAKTLSLNDIAKKNTISIVPNPSKGLVNLSALSNQSFEKITVYDMLGKEVYQQNNILKQNTTIDVSELKNGIYILKAQTTDGKVSSNRLIKN